MRTGVFTLVALIMLATYVVQAQESHNDVIEEWRCFGATDFLKEGVLVTLSRVTPIGQDRESGEVSVAGVTYRATFRVSGFDRRWDFGEGFAYSFIIRPDGSGLYYDFSDVKDGGKTSPSQHFMCVSP